MNVPIQPIMVSIFVGSLGALSLVLLVFIVSGYSPSHNLKYVLQRLFYRSDNVEQQLTDKPNVPLNDYTKWFVGLICVSLVYALGVCLEFYSDRLTRNDKPEEFWVFCRAIPGDQYLRNVAFANVFNPEHRDKLTHYEQELYYKLQYCLTDYRQTDSQKPWTNCVEMYNDNNLGALAAITVSKPIRFMRNVYQTDEQCEPFFNAAMVEYYRAKNKIFGKSTYFNELTDVERRIVFLRSTIFIGIFLFWIFFLGVVLKSGSWLASKMGMSAWLEKWSWSRHWRKLHLVRLLVLFAVACSFWMNMAIAWENEELEFDNRVFGYYLDTTESGDRTQWRTSIIATEGDHKFLSTFESKPVPDQKPETAISAEP